MEVGISAGHDEAAMLHLGGQLGLLRELQGRQRELIVPVEEAVEEFPALVAWRCALTALYASHDRPEDARAHLDLLGRDRFAAIPVDWDWLVAMRSLAIASCLLEDGDRCAVLLDLLRPFDSMNACSGWATMCCGPIATHLGALASVLERWDEAEEYFELSLRLGAALGAPPFIAQAHAAYADMLLRRGKRRRGLELAGRALAAADEMGMAEIAEQAHVLLTPRPRST